MSEIPINQDELEESAGEDRIPEGELRHGEPGDDDTEALKKYEELEKSVAQLKDQLLRKAAEFDNYKKRTEGEIVSIIRFANEDLIMKLLPVLDDFGRSLKALGGSLNSAGGGIENERGGRDAPKGPDRAEDAFIHGVRLIYGKFRKILEQAGLTAFDSAGKPFDPELHDALLQIPREDLPHHTVVEEIEKGYTLGERVLRHARVIVSSNSGGPTGGANGGPGDPPSETSGDD